MPEELKEPGLIYSPMSTEEEPEEEYALNYIVNFNNCTFNGPITIKQTGKPKDPPLPPGGS
jgi:hypothetical protein